MAVLAVLGDVAAAGTVAGFLLSLALKPRSCSAAKRAAAARRRYGCEVFA